MMRSATHRTTVRRRPIGEGLSPYPCTSTLADVGRVALALAGAVLLTASGVQAAEVDGSEPAIFGSLHPEVAGRFMANALTLTPADRAPPLVGGGPGMRAGVSVLGVYAGLSFIDFMSESSCVDYFPGACGSTHAASYGFELGYGHTFFGRLLVRGLLGIGDRIETSDGTSETCSGTGPCSMPMTTTSHASRGDLYLAPAVLVGFLLGPVLVGADATLVYMPTVGAPDSLSAAFASLSLGGQLGLRL